MARRASTWIAILAIAMISVAPAVSQSLARAGLGSPEPDCVSHALPTGHDDQHEAPSQLQLPSPCHYCSMHFTALALPLLPALPVAGAVPSHEVPSRILAAAPTQGAWTTAQPRAPPAA